MLGSAGNGLWFGRRKLNGQVRSPSTARRHGLMLGSMAPKRASRKRMSDVWSNASELTQPPRLHGETTIIGTRGPGPYTFPSEWRSVPSGTVLAPASAPVGSSDGGHGGGMWSKKPSFSSNMTSSTVVRHTSGSAMSASTTCCVYQAPWIGLDGPGCSEYAAGATTHDTCGSAPARTSARSPSSVALVSVVESPFCTSGEGAPLKNASRYRRKPASELSL